MPAGNPNIPLSVKRAKVVRQKIIERSDLGEDAEIDDALVECTEPEQANDNEDDNDAGEIQAETANDSHETGQNAHPSEGLEASSIRGTPSARVNSVSPPSTFLWPLVAMGSKKRKR